MAGAAPPSTEHPALPMTLIRTATPDDGEAFAAIYRPAVLDGATSFEADPPDAAEMARRVETVLLQTPWLACVHENAVLGYAYGTRHRERAAYRWSVEVSAYVDARARRRGVGRALYTSLLAVLRLQGFRTAVAGITMPNASSMGLHAALGFTPVGTFHCIGNKAGAWHDVAWFERELAERIAEPPPPVPLPKLTGTPELAEALQAGLRWLRMP